MVTESKDYYEILGVEPDATIDEIKKVYRRLALKWHPDKNPDNLEEATRQFQLIGRAWEILSDPQERAWYDDHRESIIGGNDGETMDGDDFCSFMMPYFSAAAFNGFGTNRNGFYAVYSEIFQEILKREQKSDKSVQFPSFGSKDSSYEDVLLFYSSWSVFTTHRSFAAADQYNTREALNRYMRRAMEKENNRNRDDARKQYNQTVLKLVDMCKKMDPRYAEAARKRQEETERKEAEKKIRLEEEKRRREEEMLSKMETCVTQTEDAERAFTLDDTVYEETGTNNLYECVVCKKVFKSETQMKNHENIFFRNHWDNLYFIKSKKHLAAVEELRKELELEEMTFTESTNVEEVKEDEIEVIEKEEKKKDKKKKQKQKVIAAVEVEEETNEEGEMSVLEMIEQMNSQNMKGRKAKNFSMNDDMETKKKDKKKKRRAQQPEPPKENTPAETKEENIQKGKNAKSKKKGKWNVYLKNNNIHLS